MKDNMDFWIQTIEKMNASLDIARDTNSILGDLCQHLGYGFGFVYRRNPQGVYVLRDDFRLYEGQALPAALDLRAELGDELIAEIAAQRRICFRECGSPDDPLAQRLSALFDARSMEMVPILSNESELIAMVGIADRRGRIRTENENPTYTHAVLCSLASYIKASLYQERAAQSYQALTGMLDNMGIDIYVNDFHTHEILYVNKSMAAPYGGAEKMIGEKCWNVLYDDLPGQCEFCPQKNLLDENGQPTKLYSWDYQRPVDGTWYRVFSAAFRWVDGRLAHVVSSVDITENKRNEEFIRRMAEYDHLTGMPNRARLARDCDALVEGNTGEFYVLFLDLDGFKQVNDTLGHHAGDDLLKQIGQTLHNNPLTQDRAYRYGGDEFVILCDGVQGSVWEVIDFLRDAFSKPWNLEGHEVYCRPAVGVSHYPVDDDKSSELIRKADHAMYSAKSDTSEMVYFFNQGNIIAMGDMKDA